eukprot:1211154-Pleurochrysis_carterae.AAC.2
MEQQKMRTIISLRLTALFYHAHWFPEHVKVFITRCVIYHLETSSISQQKISGSTEPASQPLRVAEPEENPQVRCRARIATKTRRWTESRRGSGQICATIIRIGN